MPDNTQDHRIISENFKDLWGLAQLGFLARGPGLLGIDTTVKVKGVHPIYYMPTAEVRKTDVQEHVLRMLAAYDPYTEIVVTLFKGEFQSTYRIAVVPR